MPAKKKRPTSLPETVKERATPKVRSATRLTSAALRRQQSVEQVIDEPTAEPQDARAVLVSDPTATAPESFVRPQYQPAPIIHQPQEMEAEQEMGDWEEYPSDEQPPAPLPPLTAWYETAVQNPHPKSAALPRRGKVAVKLTDNGFDVVADGADVAVQYQRSPQLPTAPTASPPPLQAEPLPFEPVQQSDIAPQLAWAAGGFLVALFLVWMAFITADRPTIIISPGSSQTEVIRP